MRAFISLELPEEIKKEIALIQQELRAHFPQARLVNPQIAHLTLAFFDSITPNKIEMVKKILEKIVYAPIKLKFYRLGCFPNIKKPRIIYLELKGDLDRLDHLVKNIRLELKRQQVFFDDKPFSAHITLARIKKHQDLTTIITKVQITQKEFLTQEIKLVKSTLISSGPTYKTLR